MTAILLTGGTGFLGSYVVARLAELRPDAHLCLLARARSAADAREKLWRALQLHMDAERFGSLLPRLEVVPGDLTAPGLGLTADARRGLAQRVDSIIHIAASLNRKSEKACLNTNLRGTLAIVKLAREIADRRGLTRFSHVSTVAVAGQRHREVVLEDTAIDWERSDYDPYARTKKFCEHMVRELLPDVPKTFFRPSIVMGDSRFPETTQFDMVRAFCFLADLPWVPLDPGARLDIVNADFVGDAVASLHLADATRHEIYHLSAGTAASTAHQIAAALAEAKGGRAPRFLPRIERPFGRLVELAGGWRAKNPVGQVAALLKVFWPYISYDTVFDNTRVVSELGRAPAPFPAYCGPLYRFAKAQRFEYPYRPLPPLPALEVAA
jgi:nucleoside-diphosphate-sugar epimerase